VDIKQVLLGALMVDAQGFLLAYGSAASAAEQL
jgi:hypothetical protein